MDNVKEVLDEYDYYKTFQQYLKDNKGVDYSIEECCNIVEWFKDTSNNCNLNPTQGVLFELGHKEAIFFIGDTNQMNRLYELYYALMYGIRGLK